MRRRSHPFAALSTANVPIDAALPFGLGRMRRAIYRPQTTVAAGFAGDAERMRAAPEGAEWQQWRDRETGGNSAEKTGAGLMSGAWRESPETQGILMRGKD